MTRPVVLLHGLASSFDHNWREPGWVDLLTEAGRTVPEINLPGHGHGPHATDPSAYADMVGDLNRRVEDLSPVDGVGFSAGGRLLLAMAAARPELFGRLAILGVGSLRREPGGALADAFDSGAVPPGGPAAVLWRLARTAGNDPAAVAAFLRGHRPDPGPADLARITGPVLFVIGEKDFDGPLSPELAAAVPQAESVVLRGIDHFATTSDYRCLDAVLSFLEA